MAESAPLLNVSNASEHDELTVATRPSRTPRFFKILRIFTLVLSTLTLVTIIANFIILNHAPFWDAYWQKRVNREVIGWVREVEPHYISIDV